MSKKLIAVKYSKSLPAPMILAKFRGYQAERAEALAKESGVAIRNEPFLAHQLYALPEGTLIPEEYFEIMAKILTAVYTLKKGGDHVLS